MIRIPEFQCDEGWWGIINEAIEKISEVVGGNYFEFEQIKEKLGGLRIYYRFDPNVIKVDIAASIRDIVKKAEAKASVTCEITGEQGSLCRKDAGWLKTLCSEKAKELGYTIVTENPINKI
jgi:hypothetical protein